MSDSKRKFKAVENGQELTIDLVRKWLDEDLSKMVGLLHILRTEPMVKDALVKLLHEKSQSARTTMEAVESELKSPE